MLFNSHSRHPLSLHPVSLSGKSLLGLIRPDQGSPIGTGHDLVGRELVTIGGTEETIFELPTVPRQVHDFKLASGPQSDHLDGSMWGFLTTFPSPGGRYMDFQPVCDGIGGYAVQSRMPVDRSKRSHQVSPSLIFRSIARGLASAYAYNVYYTTTYVASILNSFKTFWHSPRSILRGAF